MRFLLDEKASYRVCAPLKAAGRDVVHVDEIGLASTDDRVRVRPLPLRQDAGS